MNKILYVLGSVVITTSLVYALYWIHNDHPFYASLAAGLCIFLYEERLERLRKGVKNLAQRVDDLEDERDSLYD